MTLIPSGKTLDLGKQCSPVLGQEYKNLCFIEEENRKPATSSSWVKGERIQIEDHCGTKVEASNKQKCEVADGIW